MEDNKNTCKLCGGLYHIQSQYDFYGLCEGCCDEFKWQQKGIYKYSDNITGIVNSSDWIRYKQNNPNTKLKISLGIKEYIPTKCTCTHHIKEENE